MSRFIDRLNQVSRVVPPSMGFRTAPIAAPKSKILLIASLEQSGQPDYAAGADAGLLQISKTSSGMKALQEASRAVPDIPWGGWIRSTEKSEIKQIAQAGGDFVVFPAADTPLAPGQNEETGHILEVDPALSDSLLRAVNRLPLDAILTTGEPGETSLTWHNLMVFQRLSDLVTKPLLVSVPPDITADELKVLWTTGVDGMVITASTSQSADRLKELRQVIDTTDFPSQRKQGKSEALIPHLSSTESTAAEEEEEE